ncbi:MAG: alpha/beta hydrolase, partial [Planctomycetales bacterium]|nr:alpha/beta hydrolase [Planctomycetales bacterium]
VLAFDQTGFGSRMDETRSFYDRYPQWSRMGRMVQDVSAAIDVLQAEPQVDPRHIYLFGYGLGGDVALHAAALDPDIDGLVSIAGFTPMRSDFASVGSGGLAMRSKFCNLNPRLGLLVGREAQTPYDYHELLAAIAPRPALVVSPKFARNANPRDIRAAVDAAQDVYSLHNAKERLRLVEPADYARLSATMQDDAIAWLHHLAHASSSDDN